MDQVFSCSADSMLPNSEKMKYNPKSPVRLTDDEFEVCQLPICCTVVYNTQRWNLEVIMVVTI